MQPETVIAPKVAEGEPVMDPPVRFSVPGSRRLAVASESKALSASMALKSSARAARVRRAESATMTSVESFRPVGTVARGSVERDWPPLELRAEARRATARRRRFMGSAGVQVFMTPRQTGAADGLVGSMLT